MSSFCREPLSFPASGKQNLLIRVMMIKNGNGSNDDDDKNPIIRKQSIPLHRSSLLGAKYSKV